MDEWSTLEAWEFLTRRRRFYPVLQLLSGKCETSRGTADRLGRVFPQVRRRDLGAAGGRHERLRHGLALPGALRPPPTRPSGDVRGELRSPPGGPKLFHQPGCGGVVRGGSVRAHLPRALDGRFALAHGGRVRPEAVPEARGVLTDDQDEVWHAACRGSPAWPVDLQARTGKELRTRPRQRRRFKTGGEEADDGQGQAGQVGDHPESLPYRGDGRHEQPLGGGGDQGTGLASAESPSGVGPRAATGGGHRRLRLHVQAVQQALPRDPELQTTMLPHYVPRDTLREGVGSLTRHEGHSSVPEIERVSGAQPNNRCPPATFVGGGAAAEREATASAAGLLPGCGSRGRRLGGYCCEARWRSRQSRRRFSCGEVGIRLRVS